MNLPLCELCDEPIHGFPFAGGASIDCPVRGRRSWWFGAVHKICGDAFLRIIREDEPQQRRLPC